MKKGFNIFFLSLIGTLPSLAANFYTGSDTACFFGIAKSSCTLTSSKSTLGISTGSAPLSYTPASSFNAPTIVGGIVDLGTFAVTRSLAGVEAGTFDIDVLFSAPLGAGGKTYSASTLGIVILGHGGVEITFDNPTTQVFTYPGGSFDLSLPASTIFIGAGRTDILDGDITQCTTVPEPAPLFAVGLALALVGFILRRRTRRAPPRPGIL